MTREQRIEAAARAMQHRDEFSHLGSTPFDDEPEGVKDEWRVQAAWALKHAIPEIMSNPPTGWLAPMEPTAAMIEAMEIESDLYNAFQAARDAYTKEQT